MAYGNPTPEEIRRLQVAQAGGQWGQGGYGPGYVGPPVHQPPAPAPGGYGGGDTEGMPGQGPPGPPVQKHRSYPKDKSEAKARAMGWKDRQHQAWARAYQQAVARMGTDTIGGGYANQMPAVSEAQRRKLYALFGPEWMKRHHFDNKGKLPMHVPKKKSRGG